MIKLQNLLNLCYVKRWVIAPMFRRQSVAEHSYRVMVLTRMLYHNLDEAWPESEFCYAVLHALDHDEEEAVTGDIPGTYKDTTHSWPEPATMKRWETLVKVADAMETYDWWKNWGGQEIWVHQSAPEQGCDNRDIRKIVHYTQGWPELLEAVRRVMCTNLGYSEFYVKGLIG